LTEELKFQFATDTATVAVFDPDALAHRLNDSDDWWSDPDEEIPEVEAGNMALIELGQDGTYGVSAQILDAPPKPLERALRVGIRVVSGAIHVGPGEDLPAGGFATYGRSYTVGKALRCSPGTYQVQVSRQGDSLCVVAWQVDGEPRNAARQLELD
jgi:hypothetical protein